MDSGLTLPTGQLVHGEKLYICDAFARKVFVYQLDPLPLASRNRHQGPKGRLPLAEAEPPKIPLGFRQTQLLLK